MSKYDYSTYNPEHGDSVWLECNGGRVKATVIDPSQMNGKYYEPRGKTKRAFLKRTKQGKWAEATKPVDVWEGVKYMLRTEEDKVEFPIGSVRRIKEQKNIGDENYHWLICERGMQWNAKHCNPITPAEMTREQAISIVEGLD